MSRRPNDLIGTLAALCLIICVATAVVGGALITAAQVAINEAAAQQKALACARNARMCMPPTEIKK